MSTALESLSLRLASLRAQAGRSQEAGRAGRFLEGEFFPLWRVSWGEAFAACPADQVEALTLLRAEFRCMRAIEQGLSQMAEAAPELEVAMKEVVAEAQEVLTQQANEE